MRQYETFELAFQGAEPEGSHVRVKLKAQFTFEKETKTVDGFYAGNGIYKVRFYPEKSGNYVWKVTGAVSGEGEIYCEPAKAHGIVRVSGMHFKYDDGTALLAPLSMR